MLNFLVLAFAFMAAQAGYNMPAAPPPPRPERAEKPAPTAQPAAPPLVTIPAVPGRGLRDLPNTTIHYYDLAGKNLKAINKSIAELQQKKDANGHSVMTTSGWAVDAKFRKRTQNGQCKVDSATATFTATANLPRLVSEASLKANEQTVWHNFIANVETTQAASLWFAHDHARDVEQAILASSCDGAQAAGNAAVERLRQQVADFQKTYAAAATPPAPAPK